MSSLNANQQMSTSEATDAKKRTKKKKSNRDDLTQENIVRDDPTASSSSNVAVLVTNKLKSLEIFSDSEINQAMEEMFDKRLEYDSYSEVLKYLESRHTRVNDKGPPIEVAQDELRKGNNIGSSRNSHLAQDKTKPHVENGMINERSFEQKERPKQNLESLEQRKTFEETISQFLTDEVDISSILDALVKWLAKAETSSKEKFVRSSSLTRILTAVMENYTSREEMSQAESTSLIRRLSDMLTNIMDLRGATTKESFERGVTSLESTLSYVRHIELNDREKSNRVLGLCEIGNVIASIIENAYYEQKLLTSDPAVVFGGEKFAKNYRQADILDREVIATVPRGDSLLLKNTGNLTMGDIKRLFKIRDKTSQAVTSWFSCVDALTEPDKDMKSMIKSKEINMKIQLVIEDIEERMNQLKSTSDNVKQTLQESKMTGPKDIERLEDEKRDLEKEREQIEDEKAELLKKLEDVEVRLKENSTKLSSCHDSIYKMKERFSQEEIELSSKLENIMQKLEDSDIEKLISMELLNVHNSFMHASRGIGPDKSNESYLENIEKQKAKFATKWKLRAISSVDRYLGVELRCIQFVRDRISRSQAEIEKLRNQQSGSAALIPTLLEKSESMIKDLKKHVVEDEETIKNLYERAEGVLDRVNTVVKETKSVDSRTKAAVARIAANASTLGLSDLFPQGNILTSQHTVNPDNSEIKTQKAKSSWTGWGNANGHAPGNPAKSLLQIQQEEREQAQRMKMEQIQSRTDGPEEEKPK